MVLPRRGCAYHNGDTNGALYDSDGNVCSSLSREDKIFVGAAAALCTLTLAAIGSIVLIKHLRARRKARTNALSQQRDQRPMSSMGSPLLPSMSMSARSHTFSIIPQSPGQDLLLSPASTSSPYLDGGSKSSTSSHSHSHAPRSGSPYSPNPESFNFPILSADGHLLPAAPASRRQSWYDASVESARPLPEAPAPLLRHEDQRHKGGPSEQILSPIPRSPQRWSYSPGPSPERAEVVGLYPGVGMGIRHDGSLELLRDDVDVGPSPSVASSPRINRVDRRLGLYQPHSAIYHRSLSAEGEDLSEADMGSDESHRGY